MYSPCATERPEGQAGTSAEVGRIVTMEGWEVVAESVTAEDSGLGGGAVVVPVVRVGTQVKVKP